MLYYNTYYIYKTKKLMFLPLTVYRISITLFPNEVNLNMNKHNHHNNIYHNEKLRTFAQHLPRRVLERPPNVATTI